MITTCLARLRTIFDLFYEVEKKEILFMVEMMTNWFYCAWWSIVKCFFFLAVKY